MPNPDLAKSGLRTCARSLTRTLSYEDRVKNLRPVRNPDLAFRAFDQVRVKDLRPVLNPDSTEVRRV